MKSNKEFYDWLVSLNSQLYVVSDERREELLAELHQKILEICDEEGFPLYTVMFTLRFCFLAEIAREYHIVFHGSVEVYFFEKIIDSIETLQQYLQFAKLTFPEYGANGIPPLTSPTLLLKLHMVIGSETDIINNKKQRKTPPDTIGILASFLFPHIQRALQTPFAEEPIAYLSYKSMIEPLKNRDILLLAKVALQKLSLPIVEYNLQ